MLRQYLAFLLTALIALQSVAAVADAHQFHQSGTEHLTFDHDHSQLTDKLQPKQQSKIDNPDVSTNLDCHHCCHCHGMGSFFLASRPSSLAAMDLGSTLTEYQFHYSSHQDSPDNPPPIS